MKVLYVAAEAAPLVKVGGLGDVAGSLPLALKRLGVDIRLAIPWYKELDAKKWKVRKVDGVGETRLGDSQVPVYLIGKDVFAKAGKHKAIMGTKKEEKWFADFCKELIGFIKTSSWKPEVLHGNDWHVSEALLALEKTSARKLSKWGYTSENFATVVTIHNLNYHTKVLRKAIRSADVINAVSPSYSREILTKKFCAGLCKDLKKRRKDLNGVLNGIDYSVWNPRSDRLIKIQYNGSFWKRGKTENKKALRKILGLNEGGMLLAFVGRLDPGQKGVVVLAHAVEKLVAEGLQLVVLGTGDPGIEKQLKTLGKTHKGSVAAEIRYDERLAHLIYAGSDALLIPSRYEPCGLIQMIAMKYGTLPIAHAVGGLKDSIKNNKTGFLYRDYYTRGLVRAVKRAANVFRLEQGQWAKMVRAGMKEDFSWDRSAKKYLAIYRKALAKSKR